MFRVTQVMDGIKQSITKEYMKLKSVVFLIIGLIIGWVTVPFLLADSEDNSYKYLLRKLIGIVQQIELSSQQTADNTKAIKEKLGAK